jgi:O-antigen/teichoic acid export membrane protein
VQLRQRFAAYSGVEVAQLALRLGPALAAALVLPPDVAVIGTLAVLAGGAALVLAGVAVLAPHRVPRPALAAPALGAVAGLVRWYLPTMALGAALARADLVLLGLLAGPAEAGRFGAAQAIAAVPDLVGMYLGVALTPRVLALAREGRLRPFFRRAQAVLTGLALAGLGVAWGLAGWAADLPGGIAAAAPVALILLPGTALAFTTSALSLPLVMVARERWLLRVDLAVAPVALFAWAGVIGTGGGAVGAAWVTVAVMVARSLAVLAMAWHLSARAQGFAAQG